MPSKPKQPKLELSYRNLKDSRGVEYATEIHWRRGFLNDVQLSYLGEPKFVRPYRPDGTAQMMAVANELRQVLIAARRQPDRPPAALSGAVKTPKKQGRSRSTRDPKWLRKIEHSTEPLTRIRFAAQLLHGINFLLARCPRELHDDLFRTMRLYHLYSLAGDVNGLAVEAIEARMARESGPATKRKTADATRGLILRIAKEFWAKNPRYINQIIKTAELIAAGVNRTRKRTYPNTKPLAPKTIADHLSKALTGDNS